MATTMSSAFTTGDRRKRVATYGKSSRIAPSITWNDDAPSPERPRKLAGVGNGTLKRPGLSFGKSNTAGRTPSNANQPSATLDEFDFPADDEAGPPTTSVTANKPLRKQAQPVDEFDVPNSGDELTVSTQRGGRTSQPISKPDPVPRPVVAPKVVPKLSKVKTYAPEELYPRQRQRAKTPQITAAVDTRNQGELYSAKQPITKPRIASRATSPALQHKPIQKKGKSTATVPSKKSENPPASDFDVFDVPSEEDAPQRIHRRPRPIAIPHGKPLTAAGSARTEHSTGTHIESDDSDASRKRKRGASRNSNQRREVGSVEPPRESSIPPRNKKYQKKTGNVSPGHETNASSKPAQSAEKDLAKSSIHKPKRTRMRTQPVQAKPSITKGQSSPARLHNMLSVRTFSKPSPVSESPEMAAIEDETMYEIKDFTTPVARPQKSSKLTSVTPRQKQVLKNLLGDSSDATTPGMPSIRRLQLTDHKPPPLLASLTRSSSDVPQTDHARKARLIDTLKKAGPSLYEDESSDSGDETEDAVTSEESATDARVLRERPAVATDGGSAMDVDLEAPADSQASQNKVHVHTSTRVTYAKQRTYLQDTSLDEGLLLSMAFDDQLGMGGFGSNKKQDSTEDEEEDPASQVRGIHELRKKAQHDKFHADVDDAIHIITSKARNGSSLRRTTMVELCSRMADEEFLAQLLESASGHELLGNIHSHGEIIFDFAATVAVAFVMNYGPGFTLLEDILQSGVMTTLARLLDIHADIDRIAKERKTNMSKAGREIITDFRMLVQQSSIWSSMMPEKVSPQIVAMRAMDLIVLSLRKAGSTETLVQEDVIWKLLEIAKDPCARLNDEKESAQDLLTLNVIFSILEAASISRERQATWSGKVHQRLGEMMPTLFYASAAAPIKLALRLCMNLANNRPKVCDAFAGTDFVVPLVKSINDRFTLLAHGSEDEQKAEVVETLILSLGAMMNLAEFSERARRSVVANNDELVDALAKTFLEGSERAAQADSVEETQASIPIGYLSILLGNICLSDAARRKICLRLPGGSIDLLVEKIKEFVRYNEAVDRQTSQFDGDEGRETHRNFTMRLMHVVDKLEGHNH